MTKKILPNSTIPSFLEEYVVDLKEGERRRFSKCPYCNKAISSDGFVVYKEYNTVKAWCHECHSGGTYGNRISLAGVLRRRNASTQDTETYTNTIITLPKDFSRHIPSKGLQWLRKYNITDEEINRYMFGYSAKLDRLILPVFKDGVLAYWQGRDLSTRKDAPKYINVVADKKSTCFVAHPTSTPLSKTVVIVEDILSAIAVARAGFIGVSLLGSYLGNTVTKYIITLGDKFVVWLDPDKRKEASKYALFLLAKGLFAEPCVTMHKDPKEYTATEIQEHFKHLISK